MAALGKPNKINNWNWKKHNWITIAEIIVNSFFNWDLRKQTQSMNINDSVSL